MLTTSQEIKNYVIAAALIQPEDECEIEPLQGGVSCMVWKITSGETRLVLKQALAKLNVQVDWFSDVKRIEREEQAMRFLQPFLPEDALPHIVHEDANEHLYVMTCAPEKAANWKSQLMSGRFSTEAARHAGDILRRMHVNSQDAHEGQIDVFRDLRYFNELRIEPFYGYLKLQYPELQVEIDHLIDELTTIAQCLVHGDFSPKNMLVDENERIILLDYEVAHWGNPVFDVAFLLTHLMLKGWGLRREEEMYELIKAFMHAYRLEVRHVLPHIGVLLLARLDGKSPVNYILKEQLKDQIRSIAISWMKITTDGEPLIGIEAALKGESVREQN